LAAPIPASNAFVNRLHAYLAVPLPGLGLLAGRRWWGALLLAPAAAGLALAALPEVALSWRLAGVVAWAGAAALATTCHWQLARRAQPDPARIKTLARRTAADWVAGRDPSPALTALLKAAPDEAGAWDLAARIAEERGQTHLLARARRRLALIAAR
jgi:hypothetical protein